MLSELSFFSNERNLRKAVVLSVDDSLIVELHENEVLVDYVRCLEYDINHAETVAKDYCNGHSRSYAKGF